MKNFILLFVLTLIVFTDSFAQTKQSISVDTLKIGNSASAHNPTLEFSGSNVKLRANKSTGNAEFSNDGSLWKKMGSGSGAGDGGAPILENASFEDGLTPGWTSSGGALTHGSYTNSIESDLKFAQLVATASGQYLESTAKAIPDFSVGGCLAKIDYSTTDAAAWKIQVYDGSNNLLKDGESLGVKDWQSAHVSFPCPAIGTLVKIRVVSVAAGTIKVDRAYLGKENRTVNLSQYRLSSVTSYGAGTSATGWRAQSGAMTSNHSSNDVSHSGGVVTVKKSGKYFYTITVSFVAGAPNTAVGISVNNANPASFGCVYAGITGDSGARPCSGSISLNANDVVKVAEYSPSATASTGASLELYYIPSGSDTAIVPEAQDWFIDANIGGGSPSLGNFVQSAYGPIAATTIDLVLNTGSASAKIPCSSTNSPTGLTCSTGDETVGVVFTPPSAGYYEVCADFAQQVNIAAAAIIQTTFQWVETPLNAQTIIQEGKTRLSNGFNSTASAEQKSVTQKNCGTFYFGSVSEKALRLMYEQDVSGTINWNQILAARDAAQGQRDIHITVRPLLSAYNRPYLLGEKTVGFHVSRGSLPIPISAVPFVFTNVNHDSHGTYDANTGKWTSPKTGLYLCTFNINVAHTGATGQYFNVGFYVNGIASVYATERAVSGMGTQPLKFSSPMFLNKGDMIDVRNFAYNWNGAAAASDVSVFGCTLAGRE